MVKTEEKGRAGRPDNFAAKDACEDDNEGLTYSLYHIGSYEDQEPSQRVTEDNRLKQKLGVAELILGKGLRSGRRRQF
jgi:hypothetical protein